MLQYSSNRSPKAIVSTADLGPLSLGGLSDVYILLNSKYCFGTNTSMSGSMDICLRR